MPKHRIDTVGTRNALEPRGAPYWHRVRTECALGYRKQSASTPGVWVARFMGADGKYKIRSFGTLEQYPPSMRFDQAMKLANEVFDHIDRGGSVEVISVAQACERYLDKMISDGRVEAAEGARKRLTRWVFNDPIARVMLPKLTPVQCADWRTRITKGRSVMAVNRDIVPLRASLNLAKDDGLVTTSYAWDAKLKAGPNANKRRTVYLTADERTRLIESAEPYFADFLRALCLLPIRPGALAKMKVDDFDPRLNSLRVGIDKNHAERWIQLPDNTATFYKLLCEGRDKNERIFVRWDGSPWISTNWRKPIKKAARAAGLPENVVAYALRHSTITDLLAVHKLDALTVAQLAGTSVQMIDQHYGHLLRQHAADALAKLAL